MKRRYLVPFLMMLFFAIGAAEVHAEPAGLKSEAVSLKGDERYNGDYYGEPALKFPEGQPGRQARAEGQSLEEYIVDALENLEETIDVSDYNLPVSEVGEVIKILNNNPQLFYVKSEFRYSYLDDQVLSYEVSYLDGYSRDDILRMKQEMEAKVEQVLALVDVSLDDYQQALVVHDYLVQNCEYDYENYQDNTVPEISHTLYGSLVNNIAVCDGYADAFFYIMRDKLGIPCEVVSSEAMGHAWNMVEIGGEWYHVDATWDDPAWDCIGRVGHSYFLLSDSKISNGSPNAPSGENHYSWNKNHTAVSSFYDNAFWSGVNSAICYYNGAWYYSQYQREESNTTKAVKLLKKNRSQLLGDSSEEVYAASVWINKGSYYTGCFMYLAQTSKNLYFNNQSEICMVNKDGSIVSLYRPQDLEGKLIFGFTVRDGELWYAPQDRPGNNEKQTDIRKCLFPEMEGVAAADVAGVYNGEPYTIEVHGLEEDDVILYAGADGNYQPEQPVMVDAGTYEVLYKVERAGYRAYYGKAIVTIEKAEPVYELPIGLHGFIGDELGSIELPEGFFWQTDADVKLEGSGKKTFFVKFVPEDTKNYSTVNGIEVEVEVECPGHKYNSEITTPPTEEQDGLMTHTCTLCGYTYIEEIDKDLPAIAGVAAADVTEVYNGSAHVIEVTGLQEGDTIQFALPGEAFEEQQPRIINAGTYEVRYKVIREAHQPLIASAQVEVERAMPKYKTPVGLKGASGDVLGSIELPEGFLWQSDPQTQLAKAGYQKFYVCYRPEDQLNYKVATDIEVSVEVACPGHEYECVIDKVSTETQKGQKTFTCKLCGKFYTEETPVLAPARPAGVSGLKMTGRTTDSLVFSWKKTEGVCYRLMFYRGNRLVSTKYVIGNTYTYKGLKSATAYTLRVTPYRVVNERNVYAKSTGAAKAATSPAKAKLITAKRKGDSKARLSWKHVANAKGYEVYMKTGSGKYKKIKTVGKGSTLSFTKTGLSKKKSYSFKVRAYTVLDGKKVYGAYSNVKKARR